MATKLTGAQLSTGILAILPALAHLQDVLASPKFQDVEVVAEDVLKILSIFMPGAAAVEIGVEIAAEAAPGAIAAARVAVPILAATLPMWLDAYGAGGPFAPAPDGWLGAPGRPHA